MKNNSFERIMLVLILLALIYAITLLSKKQPARSYGHFQYLPYKDGEARDKMDTLLITSDETMHYPGEASCPCCPVMYMMSRSSDSTSGGPGPRFKILTKVETAPLVSDSSAQPKPPRP